MCENISFTIFLLYVKPFSKMRKAAFEIREKKLHYVKLRNDILITYSARILKEAQNTNASKNYKKKHKVCLLVASLSPGVLCIFCIKSPPPPRPPTKKRGRQFARTKNCHVYPQWTHDDISSNKYWCSLE